MNVSSEPTYLLARRTRPPVMVFSPVSASVTRKSCSGWSSWYVTSCLRPRLMVKSLVMAS